jgi:hypothetical protein
VSSFFLVDTKDETGIVKKLQNRDGAAVRSHQRWLGSADTEKIGDKVHCPSGLLLAKDGSNASRISETERSFMILSGGQKLPMIGDGPFVMARAEGLNMASNSLTTAKAVAFLAFLIFLDHSGPLRQVAHSEAPRRAPAGLKVRHRSRLPVGPMGKVTLGFRRQIRKVIGKWRPRLRGRAFAGGRRTLPTLGREPYLRNAAARPNLYPLTRACANPSAGPGFF